MIGYSEIKAMAEDERCKVEDLLVLSRTNDPFYRGTPSDWTNAEWFAQMWERFKDQGRHIRRIHYSIVSSPEPVLMPNGKPYVNTKACWAFLGVASKAARYLGLADVEEFVDRKSVTEIRARDIHEPSISIEPGTLPFQIELPRLSLPSYAAEDFIGNQRYDIEIWVEKSGLNDVLLPLCQEYGCNLVYGEGQLSLTVAVQLVLSRHTRRQRPTRILYLSDFDPAGMSMPVAAARKIEFIARQQGYEDTDIRLEHIMLTREQVEEHNVVRCPLSDGKPGQKGKAVRTKKARFEAQFGEGGAELEALASNHPEAMSEIIEGAILKYYDMTLEDRTEAAYGQLYWDLDRAEKAASAEHEQEIKQLLSEYEQLCAEFEPRISAWVKRYGAAHGKLIASLKAEQPDIDDYPLPEAAEADEDDDVLYDSQRSYWDQLSAYHATQGRISPS